MRLLLPVLALPLFIAAASIAQPPASSAHSPQNIAKVRVATECRKPTNYNANTGSAWRGGPVTPKKLTELPPATSYKAVYRIVDGCEEPLTVAEYQRTVTR